MTTAEKYRQIEKSPVISSLRLILKLIKQDCETLPLGNIIQNIKTGKTPSKQEKRFYEDAFISWFKPDEIGSSKFLNDSKDYLSKFAYDTKQVTIYEPGSILINAIGDIGRVSILLKEASSNQQITGIRLKETVNIEYAYYYLVANRHYFYVDLFQTTLPIVNQKKISIIPFILPPFDIQMRIVEGLQKLEKIESIKDIEIIEQIDWEYNWKIQAKKIFLSKFNCNEIESELTHQLSLVKQLRQAFLREAMQGKLVPQNPADGHAKDLLAKIKAEKETLRQAQGKKEKPLPPIRPEEIPFEIPEGWVWCRLGEVAEIGTGATPLTSNSDYYTNGTVPWITSSATNDLFVNETEYYITELALKETNCKVYPAGTLVIAMYGQGKTRGQITELTFPAATNQACAAISPFLTDPYHKQFIKFFFEKIYDEIRELAQGGAQPNLNMTKIWCTKIPLPPLAEQKSIVKGLKIKMNIIEGLINNIKKSKLETESLLQQVLIESLKN